MSAGKRAHGEVPDLRLPRFPPPRTGFGRWATAGQRLDAPHTHDHTRPWYRVLWLTGVDYFSTLGYQPGIALLAAGALSPVATALLVAVTLACALPVYAQVASRSYAGQGSIAMLENLLPGWWGKLVVLVLMGFAATDFVITMTLSSADAATHAIENPLLHGHLHGHEIAITLGLLALLAIVFLRGFQEAIGLATAIAIPYLLLNAIVIARGLAAVLSRDGWFTQWWHTDVPASAHAHGLALTAILVFPKLALGLSGFETGVSVMPLVRGSEEEEEGGGRPETRIRSTRKLLAAAALVMSVMLLGSSFVTTLLVPPEAYREGGKAAGRAIAYLAHDLFGHGFGTVYDFVTIVILWFAGASAMAGLLNLIPRYLPRFGMAPAWTVHSRPLVLVLFAVSALVTLAFRADVEAQAGAYATGVLVLMLSASVAVSISLWREGAEAGAAATALRARSLYFWVVSAVFAFTLVDNVWERPDGVVIASAFILGVLAIGALSRYRRATELRVAQVVFGDAESAALWPRLVGKRVNLVPIEHNRPEKRRKKAADIAEHYRADGPLAFIHVKLADNRSEFLACLRVCVRPEGEHFVIEIHGSVAIANTIAYVSELIDPRAVLLTLTRRNLMAQALRYVLWGEGETGIMVYAILLKYWERTPEDDVRPFIHLMSE